MRTRTLLLLAALGILGISKAQGDDKGAGPAVSPYPAPESFIAAGRAGEYLPQAREFLKANPLDGRSPRVVLDMLLFATAAKDQGTIKEAKLRLLLDYPQTLAAGYLVRTTQAADIRALLKERFTEKSKPLDRDTLNRFSRAVIGCLREIGPSLGDDELWAQTALAAEDAALAGYCQKQIGKPDSDAAKTLNIALGTLSDREKFVRLQELPEFKTARAWQTYLFYDKLSTAERAEGGVRTVLVENLLREHQFDDALLILNDLAKTTDDPKILFWKGWSLAATDQVPAAISVLESLSKSHPKSAWAASAREMQTALASLQSNLEEHALVVEKIFGDLRGRPPEVVSLELEMESPGSGKTQAHLGFDIPTSGISILVGKGSKPLLGYSTGTDGAKIFVQGDASIRRYSQNGAVPVLRFNVVPSDSGYHYGFNVNFSSAADGLKGALDSVLTSPAFATKEARKEFLQYHIKQGAFPTKVAVNDGEKSLRWLIPQAAEPKLQVVDVHLTADDKISAVVWNETVSVRNIRYGERNQVTLNFPKWPELPVTQGTEMGPEDMFRLMGAVMQLLNTQPQAERQTNTAEKPASPRR